jgi:hypothetical protein
MNLMGNYINYEFLEYQMVNLVKGHYTVRVY